MEGFAGGFGFGPFAVEVDEGSTLVGEGGGVFVGRDVVAAFHGGVEAGFFFHFAFGAVEGVVV